MIVAASVVAVAYFTGTWPFRNIIEREETLTGFSLVDVSSAFEVEITQSNEYSIKITADDTIMDHIQVTRSGTRLSIGIEPGILIQATTLKAEITMPELYEVRFSGATRGIATGFSSTHQLTVILSGASLLDTDITSGYLAIDLSGASQLKGTITASYDATLRLSGASIVELTGEARNLQVQEGSSASSFALSNFPVTNANINLSGATSATIKLDGRLDANLSGASNLHYIGEPTMGTINTSGGSTISQQ